MRPLETWGPNAGNPWDGIVPRYWKDPRSSFRKKSLAEILNGAKDVVLSCFIHTKID